MTNDVLNLAQVRATVSSIVNFENRFVWLWTWISNHLTACENALAAAELSMYDIAASDLPPASAADAPDAALVCELLGHLRWLDEALGRWGQMELLAQTFEGADNERYVIVRADRPPMTPKSTRFTMATAGGSIRTYARHHSCVPKTEPVGQALAAGPISSQLERVAANGRLRIEALPVDLTAKKAPQWQVSVTDPAAARTQILGAIRQAREDDVDVLVLPELSIPAESILGDAGLRATAGGEKPVIVVAGIEHHRDSSGEWVNVAVTVDRFGNELHRQHKVTRVAMQGAWEVHQTAAQTVLLPSAIGLIATPICRDLFHVDAISDSSGSLATLNLCPSLSPKTDEHRTAANVSRQRTGAVTAVCNRWGLEGGAMWPDVGPSFVLIPGADPEVVVGTDRIDITWDQR